MCYQTGFMPASVEANNLQTLFIQKGLHYCNGKIWTLDTYIYIALALGSVWLSKEQT